MADIVPTADAAKAPWQSKTLWVALITAIAAFFPSVQAFVAGSPEMVGLILAGVFALLRVISKDKIQIS